MFELQTIPAGVQTPKGRSNIYTAYNGDDIRFRVPLTLQDQPATPANSIVTFVLMDQRFTKKGSELWTGTWGVGITEVDGAHHPGVVEIHIPSEVTSALRRGSYLFAISVATKLNASRQTVFEGYLLIEYTATSATRQIPYREESL